MSHPLLELENVTIKFGGLTAVQELNTVIREGDLVGLIGPNGAGKTTAFNMITGVYKPTAGHIRVFGEDIHPEKTPLWYCVFNTIMSVVIFGVVGLLGRRIGFGGFGVLDFASILIAWIVAWAFWLMMVKKNIWARRSIALIIVVAVAVYVPVAEKENWLKLAALSIWWGVVWTFWFANTKPSELAKKGIARTFQNIRLFGSLSVLDNIRVAARMHNKQGYLGALWRGKAWKAAEAETERLAIELLEIFDLAGQRDEEAKSLPYGDQRRLEIVRALATRPKLLLLDEPAAGMNPSEKDDLMRLIRFIKERYNLAVLLVEHDMKVVMGICERIAVLEYGRKIAEGTPKEIQCHPKVIEAYLGAAAVV